MRAPPLSPSAWLRIGTVASVLNRHGVASVVEVGPGVGATSWRIARGRRYRGYEPDPESFAVAAKRLRTIPDATVRNSHLPETPQVSADGLVAFEVLEHIKDDQGALEEWIEWIRPGGLVLLSVPAHKHRFGPMDTAVGHYRRYGRDDIVSLLQAAGFSDIQVRAYGMPVGYVLEWVRNRMLVRRMARVGREEGTRRSGRSFQPKRWAAVLVTIVMAPFVLMQKPFARTELGIGWIAWGRRPS